MKRPFYIIHHNPNRIGTEDDKEGAVYALSHGANALGPDVVFIKNNFWVLHSNNPAETTDGAPLLRDYLTELAEIVKARIRAAVFSGTLLSVGLMPGVAGLISVFVFYDCFRHFV